MKTHLALLRGVNVSGQKLIKMEDLRNQLTDAGFQNVATYIQSGNILIDTDEKSKEKVGGKIKTLIAEKYGWDVGVLMLDLKSLQEVADNNPYLSEANVDVKQLYVAFLSGKPTAENLAKFRDFDTGDDQAALKGNVLYLKYAHGAGKTKLTNALIENKLKVVATSRNWHTTLKLLEMLAARN